MIPHSPGSPLNPPLRRRILVVDDNTDARMALQRMLQHYGYSVTAVPDGTSALAALRADPPPEVVLSDLLLPDLDGREVCLQASRRTPRPLVALMTGWELSPDPAELEPWGIDLVYSKPLPLGNLLARLEHLAGPDPGEDGAS